ncbi:MAG: hypothetical protein R3B40_31805 [Polyangiales bacterium]
MSNSEIRPTIFTTLVARKLKRATSYQYCVRVVLSGSGVDSDSMGSVHRFWTVLAQLLEPVAADALVAVGPTQRPDTIALQIHTDVLLDAERWVVGLNDRSAWTAELSESQDLACFPLALWNGLALHRTALVDYVSKRDGSVRWRRSRVLPGPSMERSPPPWNEDDAPFPTVLFGEDWEGRYEEDVPALGVDVYVPAAIERRARFEVQLARRPEEAVRQSFMSQLLFECVPLLDCGHAYVWLVGVDQPDTMAVEILGDQLANDLSLQARVAAVLKQAEHVIDVRPCGVICDVATGDLPHYEGVFGEARGILWEVEPSVCLLMAPSTHGDGRWGWAGSTWRGEPWLEHLTFRQLRQLRRYEFVDPDGPSRSARAQALNHHLVAVDPVAAPPDDPPLVRSDSEPRVVAKAQQDDDGSFSALIEHIADHGFMTEEDAVRLAGSARAYRRFVRKLDEIAAVLPFRLEVVSSGGHKSYIRR